ncbi:TPA: hypothetical protein ACK3Q6_000267 [Burkholderia cepacia]|uniref:hypothetical protein n=1 Tax=Burkholderia cepacia TaxID=292 RepID=UPI0012D9813A|nr:hypothetical protein [Burkholderia cepacia]MCA8360370.1 hypothetical protein [Burkholderia cepacia]UIY59383.1 hypothetical protein LZ568_30690 [Burkholderia cepacia]HDR9756037.1 hypothetical protein [Burkholderia cepacia ATCC 25416]HDV6368361.1 hypothetical protein [Burkholderia cepacia]
MQYPLVMGWGGRLRLPYTARCATSRSAVASRGVAFYNCVMISLPGSIRICALRAGQNTQRVVFKMRRRDPKPILRHDSLQLVPIVVFKNQFLGRPMTAQLANQPTINVILEALVLEHLEPVVLDVATRVIVRQLNILDRTPRIHPVC